jgi:hypothetical protein
MPGIVLTFPILPGKVEAWRRFCQEMAGSRLTQYEASRRRLGITCERMALVENGFGAAAVTTLEAEDIGQALGQIIASDLPFDNWYRERLAALHGVNLTRYEQFAQPEPPALPQELLFEWSMPDGPSR